MAHYPFAKSDWRLDFDSDSNPVDHNDDWKPISVQTDSLPKEHYDSLSAETGCSTYSDHTLIDPAEYFYYDSQVLAPLGHVPASPFTQFGKDLSEIQDIAWAEYQPGTKTDFAEGHSSLTCCWQPDVWNLDLGDPNPDTRWHAMKATDKFFDPQGPELLPGHSAPARDSRSRSEPPPVRHKSFFRARYNFAPEGDGQDRGTGEANPAGAIPDSWKPLETGGPLLQLTRPDDSHTFPSGSALVHSLDRHDSPLDLLAEPEPSVNTQVAEASHTQAIKPADPPLPCGTPIDYTRPFRRACDGSEPSDTSVESTWDNYTDRQSHQRWCSISTSSRRMDGTTRDQSVAMESQMSGDTAMTDDTVQLPWNSDDRFAMESSHPFLSVESHAVQEVVSCFQEWNLGGGSAAASKSPFTSISASSSQAQQQEQGKSPLKRPARDGDEPGENGEDGPPPKKQSRKRVPQGQPRLACHFQKRYPERHPACGGYLLIAHVKQHLRNKHKRSPYYCPRCNFEFKTEEERDDHIELMVSSPCQKRVYDASTQISARVAKQLEKRVESAFKLHEQWFSVWDTIFPGVPRPASCTYDICSELPVQVLGLYSYLETEGPGTVISVLQRHGLNITPEGGRQHIPPDLQTYIRRVLFQACREIYQNWQSQREQERSPNSSPTDRTNTSPNPPIHISIDGNIKEGSHTSVEPNSPNRTNAAVCTPTSSSKVGSSVMNLPMEISSDQGRRANESGTQRQSDHGSPRTPISMLDGNGNESSFSWRAGTAIYGGMSFDDYTPQDGAFSTLQYPLEDGHMADVVCNFDLSAFEDFSTGNEEVT